MSHEIFPKNYNDWKICITEKCGIPLTTDFVQARIESLSDGSSEERKKFIEYYGIQWVNQVVSYFKQALG